MKESDTGQDSKKPIRNKKSGQKSAGFFLIAKWRLIHYTSITYSKHVVVAGVKLKILKANHNQLKARNAGLEVVVAGVKLKILKANHNGHSDVQSAQEVVVAGVKLKILKANYNVLRLVVSLR